jgi:hypothetical protein
MNKKSEIKIKDVLIDLKTSIDSLNSKAEILFKPGRIFIVSFMSGIARGVGTALGLTVIMAILIAVLSSVVPHMIQMPVIGRYIAELVQIVEGYLDKGVLPK